MKQGIIAVFFLLMTVLTAGAQTDTEHVRLTNLPHVYLETFSGQPITSKNIMILARMWYVDEQDNVTFYDSLQTRVRGNSTANLAKKPYKLKFQSKVKLLGKGHANTKKWTLLANHADKTLFRNALTSLMGEWTGLTFNPAAKFVDLTLNGQYIGNYQLSDQVDVRKHRVDVAEQDNPLTEESNITGGYLLEADGFADFTTRPQGPNNSPTGFYSRVIGAPVRIHYPDEDEIAPEQYSYIRGVVDDFEQCLFSDNFSDPLTGYRQLVDSTSLVNWYLCTEISANVDGFFSTYFYKDKNDNHLYWGPLWDYDIAYNNDNRTDRGGTSNTERQLMKDYGYGGNRNGCRQWFYQMWNDPWFARLVNRRYQELIDNGIEDYLNEKIDSLVTLLDASQQLNYERWGISVRALRERILHSSYDSYVADVRTFITRHLDYLSDAFAALQSSDPVPGDEVNVPDFIADANSYYVIANGKTGTCFDVDMQTDELCARKRDESSESQQWQITNLSNGYLFIVNRATGQALSDSSPVGSTATTNTGGSIMLVDADSTDTRQLWDFVKQVDGMYNVISRWSYHAANLNGGNAADGTKILSYTSDGRNASSSNRLWRIKKSETIVEDAVNSLEQDYALAYDPQQERLHFGADDMQALSFRVSIYDRSGRQVAAFRASDGFMMSALPKGLYIISWNDNGRRRSVKLMK